MKAFTGYCIDRYRGKLWSWVPIYRLKTEAETYSRDHSVVSVTVLSTKQYRKMRAELTRLREKVKEYNSRLAKLANAREVLEERAGYQCHREYGKWLDAQKRIAEEE